jgi:hypothetical protein
MRGGADVLETRYAPDYTEEHEQLMMRRYMGRVKAIGNKPSGFLVFVAGTRVSADYVHDNVKKVLSQVIDRLGDRYMLFDNSVSAEGLAVIGGRITEETYIMAWGEKTSGCVWSELLHVCDALSVRDDINFRKRLINPLFGVDVKSCSTDHSILHGYPRPWETLSVEQYEKRLQEFDQILEHNYRYHRGMQGYEFPVSEL